MSEFTNPMRYLREAINTQIYVKLKDGTEYVGVLRVTDATMNLILDDAVEVRGGKQIVARIGRVLIRGSTLQYISFNPEIAAEQALSQ
ncbi:MAG: U6 snRNA-associated Sm-like protein LSm6 [Acidilobaceae archaeon]|nr:U6 snRNA-associated Sm-like protein LSm6 [Acidilobaceae archaeon]MCX8165262.1 U6 snRNA-associated Sm-like protein LSm6 [Acidilobaceae archaeon]MDW7973688.1 U6 snRNA-associated Sm-like protein LSm6 [Sulfolobales archaeon]